MRRYSLLCRWFLGLLAFHERKRAPPHPLLGRFSALIETFMTSVYGRLSGYIVGGIECISYYSSPV